jgi:hypothetical protein
MWEVALLLVLAFVGWLAFDALRARETAIGFARAACDRQGLQFLDFTVQGSGVRIARDAQGHAALRRTYRFEFSEDGANRRAGTIVVLGKGVESLELEPYRLP